MLLFPLFNIFSSCGKSNLSLRLSVLSLASEKEENVQVYPKGDIHQNNPTSLHLVFSFPTLAFNCVRIPPFYSIMICQMLSSGKRHRVLTGAYPPLTDQILFFLALYQPVLNTFTYWAELR